MDGKLFTQQFPELFCHGVDEVWKWACHLRCHVSITAIRLELINDHWCRLYLFFFCFLHSVITVTVFICSLLQTFWLLCLFPISFLFGHYFLFGFNRVMDREAEMYQNTVSLQTWIHLLFLCRLKRTEVWQHGLTFPKLPFPIALRIWKWSKFTVRKKEEQKLLVNEHYTQSLK